MLLRQREKSKKVMTNLVITPEKIALLKEKELMCMRDQWGRLLNVSYTEEGLRWTFDKLGRPMYYTYPNTVFTNYGYLNARFVGTMEKNPYVTIEKFVPVNHYNENGTINLSKQKAEILYLDKALRIIFPMNETTGTSENIQDGLKRIIDSRKLTV